MQHLATLDQHGVVSHLLRERVLEGILRLRKGRLLVDELSSLEVGELGLQIRFRFAHYLLEQTQGKFFAHDGQGLQECLVVGWEPVDACSKDTLHGGWNTDLSEIYGRGGSQTRPYSGVTHQHLLLNQCLDDLFHEKGIPFGFLQNEALER